MQENSLVQQSPQPQRRPYSPSRQEIPEFASIIQQTCLLSQTGPYHSLHPFSVHVYALFFTFFF